MGGEPWTKVIIATEDLNDAGREELLGKFAELQTTVWCEGGWFDNNRVTTQDRGRELAAGKMDREIPGHDTDGNSEGCISNNNLLLAIFFDNLFLQFELG